MIVRKNFQLHTAIRYSWKNIAVSTLAAGLAYAAYILSGKEVLAVPTMVVAILGTALAIVLGFRNSSAYDRWWEARKIWSSISAESRTITRQVLTIVDPKNVPEKLWAESVQVVQRQLAWINALRLQLRACTDQVDWDRGVGSNLSEADYQLIMTKRNKVTWLAMLQGDQIKEMNVNDDLDTFSYIQMDDTLTRLTELQARCEKMKDTPLPRPYDYYTVAFLNLFIFFFPFAIMRQLDTWGETPLVFPITILVGWMFYQIYVLGLVLSRPFDNIKTDVALDAICRDIEIDLKEIIHHEHIPPDLKPVRGVLM